MARKRAPSTKNVYMMWNTCNKRKSVTVRLVSSFFYSARITHFSRRCLDRSSTRPSFMKARSSKKALVALPQHALQVSVVPFVAPSGVPRGIPEKKSAVRQMQREVVLRHEQSHWNHQHQVPPVHIHQALHCQWSERHRVVVADVHVLHQLLACSQHLPVIGHGVWVLPDHQTVKFPDLGSSVVGAAWSGHSHRQFNISQTQQF